MRITNLLAILHDDRINPPVYLLKIYFTMKAKFIIITILLILLALLLVSKNFFQSPVGPHGGIVKPAGEYNIEMKNIYPNIYTFLLNKKNKPILNKKISCEISFLLPNNTIINTQLRPFAKDGFMMELGGLNYSSCRIFFNVSGKSISTEFESENPIVQEKTILKK